MKRPYLAIVKRHTERGPDAAGATSENLLPRRPRRGQAAAPLAFSGPINCTRRSGQRPALHREKAEGTGPATPSATCLRARCQTRSGDSPEDVSSESEGDEVPAQTQTRNRFLERLETGPAIVGDGGMGALLSAAVPRLRTPEEANLRAPQAVVSLHVS